MSALMNALALGLGWAAMAIGGLAVVTLAGALAMNYAWRKLRDLRGWVWLQKAMKHYGRIEPPP